MIVDVYYFKDKMWVVVSRQNTVILRMGLDITNKVFVYEYMADPGGKLGLKTGSTKECQIPKSGDTPHAFLLYQPTKPSVSFPVL